MTAIATPQRHTNRRRHLLAVPSTAVQADSRLESRWSSLTIRLAVAADVAPLQHLAQMDSARSLSGQALLAEQGGAVIAALSLGDGAVIADPFVPSADAVAMLRLRAGQLRDSATAA